MAETDGQIEIGVKIDTKEVEPQIQKLEQKLLKQNEALERQRITVERLTARYEELYEKAKQTAKPNIESEKVLAEIGVLENRYKELQNLYSQAKLEPSIDQSKINNILNDLDVVWKKLTELRKKQQELQFAPDMQNKLRLLGQQIDVAIQKENRLTDEVKSTEFEIDNLSKKRIDSLKDSVDRVKNSFSSLGNKVQETQNSVVNYAKNGIGNTFSRIGNTISGIGKRILSLGASAFVFNVISAGFRQMSNGIQNIIANDNQLSNSLAQVRANLMTAFYPIYQAILPAIQALGRALSWVTGQIASFMAMITGTSIKLNQEGAKGLIAQTSGMSKQTKQLNKQAKGYDNVAKSVKKAKGQLASFDKIEVLKMNKKDKTPKGNGGLGGDSLGGGVGALKGFNQEIKKINLAPFDKIIKKFKALGNIFKKGFDIGFVDKNFDEIVNSANRCFVVVKKLFNDPDLVQGFNNALDSIVFNLGKVVGSVSSVGVTIGRLLVGGIAGYLEQSQDIIKGNLLRAFDITQEMYGFIGDFSTAFANIFEVFASPQAQNSFANMLTGWEALSSSFYLNFWDICVSLTEAILSPFVDLQDDIKQAFDGALKSVEKFTSGIRDIFVTLGNAMSDVTQKSIKPAIKSIGKIWGDVFGTIIKFWNEKVNPMLIRIGEKFNEVVNEHIKPAIEKVSDAFNRMVDKILPLIKKLWRKIKPFVDWVIETLGDSLVASIESTFNTIADVISGICRIVADMWDTTDKFLGFIINLLNGDWDNAWRSAGEVMEGLKRTCESVARTLGSVVKGMIDLIISGINVGIRALNKISFNLPDWLGGGHFGLNIPQVPKTWINNIPHLAQGAVLEGGHPFLAMLNDQPKGQTNIETPLSTMIEAFKQANKQSNPNIVIEANGDFSQFIRMLNFKLKEEDSRVGQSFVSGDVWV